MTSIRLHRFPLSHFSEKGRALLDFKELDFEIVEHQLGLPQLGIVRLSGQRKVPVIEHDGRVVADSTRIALYLEEQFPERRRLLPDDENRRREVLELEDRIDRVFGRAAPVAWFDAISRDRDAVAQVLDVEVYGVGAHSARVWALAAQAAWKLPVPTRMAERAHRSTRKLLGELCTRLDGSKYLCGDEPTLADIAAVGLTFHLEFPHSRDLRVPALAGVGVPAFVDDPDLARFFEWRRAFYRDLLH